MLSIALACPAYAGEAIEGDGYSIHLPDHFSELMSIENAGELHITSRFGGLPVDGVPEIKAYTSGEAGHPDGLIVVARVNLTRTITTAKELGLDRLERIRERLPDGAEVHATKVGSRDALEIRIPRAGDDSDRTVHVLSVAVGDYVVVLSMDTSDESFRDSSALWRAMVTSLKIEPGMNKGLLFGLIGAGGLLALFLLSKVGKRMANETPEYTGRFKRFQEGGGVGPLDTGPGLPPRQAAEFGRRPKVLPTSAPPSTGEASFAGARPMAPSRTPTSPAVTRPTPRGTPARPGLKTTRPQSGRWGD